MAQSQSTRDGTDEARPPLPPRPSLLHAATKSAVGPTTAVSSVDIQTLTFPDGSRGTFTTSRDGNNNSELSTLAKNARSGSSPEQSERGDDVTSMTSSGPGLRASTELESLLEETLKTQSPAWQLLSTQNEVALLSDSTVDQDLSLATFDTEFDELAATKLGNEEDILLQWKLKLKHFLILSSAGKPIYSRHGDQNLINGYIGIIQTIISAFQSSGDSLLGFTAGDTRFVVMAEGPLFLMAISRLEESDAQLRSQLEALYMQVLSTLTLPNLTHIFSNRPNTDLRRPLEGTEILLSSLADTFTKGSPIALLSALECLRLRKSERHVINNTLLKARTDRLLYGLIVAGGRLVSVARPKRHSLHPNDLQLIFNMLFEAGSIKENGGENWIPLCLPNFNNRGFLYMYVSFLNQSKLDESADDKPFQKDCDETIAIVLISSEKESFFELKEMRDEVVDQLQVSGSMDIIKDAVKLGRPKILDIAPGVSIAHFIFKSRTNVQFLMPSLPQQYDGLVARRRLMSLYHTLHASAHSKYNHLKVLHCVNRDSVSLAWVTPLFEFYCVAGPRVTRAALAQGANRIIQWVKREEQRIFIFGGAVF